MPKYEVTLSETIFHTVEVEADDTDEALELATELVVNGDGRDAFVDSQGINTNGGWVVEIKEETNE